jgi:hypothetical protein
MTANDPADMDLGEAARVRLRNTLWLILNAQGGSFTLSKAEFKDYPGEDRIAIEMSEDRAAGTITFRATTVKKGGS